MRAPAAVSMYLTGGMAAGERYDSTVASYMFRIPRRVRHSRVCVGFSQGGLPPGIWTPIA